MKPEPPAPLNPPERPVAPAIVGPNLTYISADADLIVHVDVAALRQSTLWPTYESHIAKLLVLRTDCDYAPLHDASTVDIAITLETNLTLLVVRGIDREQMLRCLKRGSASFDGDVVTVTRGSSADVLTFVDPTTMLMQKGKRPTKATLTTVLHDNSAPARTNQAFSAALQHLPPHAAVVFASRPNSKDIRAKLETSGGDFELVYGSMDTTPAPSIRTKLAMVFDKPDEPKKLASTLQAQLKSVQIKLMFDLNELAANGNTLTMELDMNEQQLSSMVQLFAMLSSD